MRNLWIASLSQDKVREIVMQNPARSGRNSVVGRMPAQVRRWTPRARCVETGCLAWLRNGHGANAPVPLRTTYLQTCGSGKRRGRLTIRAAGGEDSIR